MKEIINLVEDVFNKIIDGSITEDDLPRGLRVRVSLVDKKIHCKSNYPFSFDFTPKCNDLVSFLQQKLSNTTGFIDIERHVVTNRLSVLHIFNNHNGLPTTMAVGIT